MAKYFGHHQLGSTSRAGLFVLAAVASGVPARAQNTPGTKLTIIIRTDPQNPKHEFAFGWKGISATTVFGRPPARYDRSDVRTVCQGERCPSDMPQDEVGQDIVGWRSGKTTVGHVDGVYCTEYDVCTIVQDGKQSDWWDVNYVRLAPPAAQ